MSSQKKKSKGAVKVLCIASLVFLICCVTVQASSVFSIDAHKSKGHQLYIDFTDSVTAPDLSQLQVTGNQVENAILIQQNSLEIPTVFQLGVVSIPDRPGFYVQHWNKKTQKVTVLSPREWEWEIGQILIDTTQGGISHKVVRVNASREIDNRTEWDLVLRPAKLEEVVLQCDLTFISHPNLKWTAPDSQWYEYQGTRPIKSHISKVVGTLQGRIQGNLRISNGTIEDLTLDLLGNTTVKGLFQIQGITQEVYRTSQNIPMSFRYWIPLDAGIYVALDHNWDLDLEYTLFSEHDLDSTGIQQELNLSGTVRLSAYYENQSWEVSHYRQQVERSLDNINGSETIAIPNAQGSLTTTQTSSLILNVLGQGEAGFSTSLLQETRLDTIEQMLPSAQINAQIRGGITSTGTFSPFYGNKKPHVFFEKSDTSQIWKAPPSTPELWIEEKTQNLLEWNVTPDVQQYQVQVRDQNEKGGTLWTTVAQVQVPPVSIPYRGEDTLLVRVLAMNSWGVSVSQELVLDALKEPHYDTTVWAKIPAGVWPSSGVASIEIPSFLIQKYEVTQKAYTEIQGNNPSYWKGDNRPVERVSWHQAASYCESIDGRLPTEKEWEYAALTGKDSEYYWEHESAQEHAWFFKNAKKKTQVVGTKKPNAWDLYDMSGNVFEWTHDWYSSKEIAKVVKGGSWLSDEGSLKALSRFKNRPSSSSYKLGFRCVQDIES